MPSARCRPVPGVADLRAGHQGRTVVEAGRRCCSARALRDIFIDLAVLVGTRAEALDRRDDHARIELLDALPRESHPVERAGREILDQHVAFLHQRLEDFLALRILGVDGDRALVVVEHREIEAVDVGDVAQLAARDVALARSLHLDDVGAQPCQKLRAGRARLHVGEVENLDAVQCLAHYVPLSIAVTPRSCTKRRRSIARRVERWRVAAAKGKMQFRRRSNAARMVERPHAVRALCEVAPSTTLQRGERS